MSFVPDGIVQMRPLDVEFFLYIATEVVVRALILQSTTSRSTIFTSSSSSGASVGALVRSESSAAPAWLPTLYKSLAALPYLAALFFYFRICKSIARSRSFSRENVRSLGCIARLLWAAVALWALGLLLLAFGVAPILTQPAPLACTLLVLAAATIAVSLVAWSLERLLAHAVRLQEENELTI